ncbi:MAG: DUF72 domain-containing protein, partial [Candidatus Omnitrophota bacterium]
MTNKIHIGTSGWSYDHWRGAFYPDDLARVKWFDYYCEHFKTVEINNSFYHLPSIETFKNWREEAPEDFIFSVKASRFITHMKKLKDPKKSLEKFLTHSANLKEKLGPILFQLPPHWKLNLERLENFIKHLPRDLKAVFEFRENSWFCKDVYDLLSEAGYGFCVHDMQDINCPRVITASPVYIRFHGTAYVYGGKYTRTQLKDWAGFIKKCAKNSEVYVYFNNDAHGSSAENALELKKILGV